MERGTSTRTLIAACAVLLAGTWAWQATARQSGAAQPAERSRVAIVNVQAVLNGLEEIEKFNTDLSTSVAAKQAELNGYTEQLKAKQLSLDELPANAIEARRRVLSEIFELQVLARARKEILQNDIDVSKGQAIRLAYDKMLGAVKTISERDQFDVVLFDDRGITVPEGLAMDRVNAMIQERRVLHATDAVDLTQRVLDWMNNQHRAGG